MQWTNFIQQSWIIAGGIGLGTFLLGVLIPKKSGASWLSGILFWPIALLRDLLDAAHTKRLQYYALLLALLGMEAFFSVRAATVYYDVLSTRMSVVEVDLVSIIIGCAVFLCGYMVASHGVKHASGKMDWSNFGIAALVVVHDIAGTVWLNYGPGATGGGDWASVSITVGMCAFSLVPFALGNRAEKLRPELESELDQEVETFTSAATRTIKRRAVDRVLRLANRTDVIHLVRSLPADEFANFKSFVMPIIAPGTPYNLPVEPSEWLSETSQNDGQNATKMTEQNQSDWQAEATHFDSQKPVRMSVKNLSNDRQSDNQKSGKVTTRNQSEISQTDKQKPIKMAVRNQSKWQSETSQDDSHLIVKTTRKNLSNDSQNDNQSDMQKPASKTARRDAKIRQFAANHPELTHAKLATKFKVSVSTVARAFSTPHNMPQQTEDVVSVLKEVLESNGHHKQERDTDKLTAVSVNDEIALVSQN